MKTKAILEKKRKNIDIPIDIFRNLSIRAAAEGKSLKAFIENILILEANALSDEEIYRTLVFSKPAGNEYLSEQEQANFENWLGV